MSLVSSCQKKQGISRLFRCNRSHFHKICLPVILHFSGSGKNPVFTAYRRLNIKLIKYLWSGIEAVITRTTRNRLTAKNRPWVRIPPAPPTEKHGTECRVFSLASGLKRGDSIVRLLRASRTTFIMSVSFIQAIVDRFLQIILYSYFLTTFQILH